MVKIYISGQITGRKDYMEQFAAAEAYIRQEADNGALIYNPARINAEMPKGADYEDYMAVAMAILERCDNIYMLPGWQKSPGANREYGYASASKNIWIYELTEENLADGRTFLNGIEEPNNKIDKLFYKVVFDTVTGSYETKVVRIDKSVDKKFIDDLTGKILFSTVEEIKPVINAMNAIWGKADE